MQRNDTTALTKRLGKKLRNLRGKKSQQDFADAIGLTRGYLSDLERGTREMSLTTLTTICERTGAKPNALLGL